MAKEKNKKSFFGRLLGANDAQPEAKQKVEMKKEIKQEKTETKTEAPATAEAKPATEEKQEDWIQDYEGQLTIDVYQTPENIIIKSTIAGVRPEDIDIAINDDMVTIKGERKNDIRVKEEDYFYQECYWGGFSRSVILPVEVEADKADADLKNGILTITLPKANTVKTKKISVKGA